MRRCEELAELYGAYVYGDTTPEETNLIKEHLETCEKCRVDVETQQMVIGKIPNALPKLSDDDRQAVALAVKSRIRASKEERSWWRTVSPFLQTASVAATIVVVFASGTMFGFHLKGKLTPIPAHQAPEKNTADVQVEPAPQPDQHESIAPDVYQAAPSGSGDSFDRSPINSETSRLGWDWRMGWPVGTLETPQQTTESSEPKASEDEDKKPSDDKDAKQKDKISEEKDPQSVDTPEYPWNVPVDESIQQDPASPQNTKQE